MGVIHTRFLLSGVAVLCLSAMAGCATVHKPPVVPTGETAIHETRETRERKGIYHKVMKGETLWRIAKTYKTSPDDIIQANNIPNAASIEENQLLFIPGADAVQKVPLPAASVGKDADYLWPLKGRIVSYFEDRKGAAKNPGIDIKGGEGDIVRASRDGRVVFADRLSGYGFTVIIDHSDGFFTVYGHAARLLVSLGAYVFRGEKIAQLSSDGPASFMHFELRKGDIAKNPLHYLPREM